MRKRIVAILLTIALLMGILPTGVFALDDSVCLFSYREINPIYENILPEEAKEEILAELDEIAAQEPENAGDALQGYLTEEQLVPAIRSNLLERNNSFTIQFCTASNCDGSYFSDCFQQAFAHDGIGDHGDYIFWNLVGWGWSGSYEIIGDYCYYTLTFHCSYNTSTSQEIQVTNAVDSLIESFGFGNNTPVVYKIKTIYDWICSNVTYDYEHLNTDPGYRTMYSAYGAIIDRTCVCQGYALLLYRLLLTVGVDSRIVTSSDHGWNIVNLGSSWYYADSTWDAGDPYEYWWYFLAGTESFDVTHSNSSHVREDGTDHGGYDYTYGSDFDRAHPMASNDYSLSACEISDHSFQSVIDKEPTCSDTGIKNTTCTVCGETYAEELPAGKHSLTPTAANAATCTTAGNSAYFTCSSCHGVFKDENGTEQTTVAADTIPALGHSFTTYIYNNDAKVGVDGTETAICDRCDATDTRTKSGTALPTPTTVNPEDVCTRGRAMTFLWRAAGSPVPFSTNNPFTDVKSNNYFYQPVLWAVENAIASGKTATIFGPNDTVTRAAAATFLYRYCQPTNYPESTIIGQPFTDVSSNAYYANAVNWLSTKVTNLGTEFKPNSVCTNEDFILFLYGVCNGSADANDKVSAWSWAENNDLLFTTVHTWDEGTITTEPTCAEMGVKTYTCSECGEIKAEIIPALGHSLSKTEATSATCTAPGNIKYYTCKTCSKYFSDEDCQNEIQKEIWVTPATGHNWSKVWTSDKTNHWHLCTNCGAKNDMAVHVASGVATEDTPETCIICKYVISPALGHIHGNHLAPIEAKEATCTTAGNKAYYVCDCGTWFEDTDSLVALTDHSSVVIAAKGHAAEIIPRKAATCTESGLTEGSKCSVCGEVLVAQDTIPALGHSFTTSYNKIQVNISDISRL